MFHEKIEPLKRQRIVLALVSDSLGKPKIKCLLDYPSYTALISNPLVLRGMDEVELRVLEVDKVKKQVRVCFHAMRRFSPDVSTGRAILVTYISMKNTVYHIIRRFFSFRLVL